jgi:hypothetical protein
VHDRAGPRNDLCALREPGVTLDVQPLTDNSEVGLQRIKRADQSVDVPPDAASVGRHGGCVNEDARPHGGIPLVQRIDLAMSCVRPGW